MGPYKSFSSYYKEALISNLSKTVIDYKEQNSKSAELHLSVL